MDSTLEGFRVRFFVRFFVAFLSLYSCDFLDKPYQIATNFGTRKTQFQIGIRIGNFPSFVTSKADYDTDDVIVNDTEWCIELRLNKYCQNEKKYIHVTPSSSDQPEALGAYILGSRNDEKDSSFIVNATFTFKQPLMSGGFRTPARRFDLNATNDFHQGWGVSAIAKIDVINYKFYYAFETFQFSDRIF